MTNQEAFQCAFDYAKKGKGSADFVPKKKAPQFYPGTPGLDYYAPVLPTECYSKDGIHPLTEKEPVMTKPTFTPLQEDIEKQVCLRESLKQSELTVKKLQEENKSFRGILADMKNEKEKLQRHQRWLESELNHKDSIIDERDTQMEKLQSDISHLKSEKTDADHALMILHSIMDAGLKIKLDEANSQLNTTRLELNNAMMFCRDTQVKANQEIVQKLAELISSVKGTWEPAIGPMVEE